MVYRVQVWRWAHDGLRMGMGLSCLGTASTALPGSGRGSKQAGRVPWGWHRAREASSSPFPHEQPPTNWPSRLSHHQHPHRQIGCATQHLPSKGAAPTKSGPFQLAYDLGHRVVWDIARQPAPPASGRPFLPVPLTSRHGNGQKRRSPAGPRGLANSFSPPVA